MILSTPLDDFLTDSPASDAAVRLETIGLAVALPSLMVSIGLIAYLAMHRGERREVTALVRVAVVVAVAAAFGAIIEVLGASELFDISWADAFADGTASAPMMRLLAAIMIALGLYDHAIPVDRTETIDDELDDSFDQVVRWVPSAASAFAMVGAAVAVMSFAFDGHTVDTTPRAVVAMLDALHVTAGAVWLGGVVGLVLISVCFRRTTGSIAGLIIRFSGVAALSLLTVAISGALMSWAIADGFGSYTNTEWGQRLLAKLVLVSVAAACGAYNRIWVVPRLGPAAGEARKAGDQWGDDLVDDTSNDDALTVASSERIARRVLLIEALAFVGVLAVTVILVQASTV